MKSLLDHPAFGGASEAEGEDTPGKLQAFYSVPEFARLCGVNRNSMARLLTKAHVEFVGRGRGRRVPLSEIRDKLPIVYRSFLLAMNNASDD